MVRQGFRDDMRDWILCKDKLPEPETEVLTVRENGENSYLYGIETRYRSSYICDTGLKEHDLWFDQYSSEWCDGELEPPIAWMPIPEFDVTDLDSNSIINGCDAGGKIGGWTITE